MVPLSPTLSHLDSVLEGPFGGGILLLHRWTHESGGRRGR